MFNQFIRKNILFIIGLIISNACVAQADIEDAVVSIKPTMNNGLLDLVSEYLPIALSGGSLRYELCNHFDNSLLILCSLNILLWECVRLQNYNDLFKKAQEGKRIKLSNPATLAALSASSFFLGWFGYGLLAEIYSNEEF